MGILRYFLMFIFFTTSFSINSQPITLEEKLERCDNKNESLENALDKIKKDYNKKEKKLVDRINNLEKVKSKLKLKSIAKDSTITELQNMLLVLKDSTHTLERVKYILSIKEEESYNKLNNLQDRLERYNIQVDTILNTNERLKSEILQYKDEYLDKIYLQEKKIFFMGSIYNFKEPIISLEYQNNSFNFKKEDIENKVYDLIRLFKLLYKYDNSVKVRIIGTSYKKERKSQHHILGQKRVQRFYTFIKDELYSVIDRNYKINENLKSSKTKVYDERLLNNIGIEIIVCK